MLMGPDDGGIDHRVFVVGLLRQMSEHLLPNATFSPPSVTAVNVLPVAKPLRQIAPGNACAIPVKNRFPKQPVILRLCPCGVLAPRQ
ncbi:MAG: hypothetical protein OJF51_003656 [Nitrospira sp.]|nr:MAG: hypothetical protein OJF51_003656 [Nitrospira sp.]